MNPPQVDPLGIVVCCSAEGREHGGMFLLHLVDNRPLAAVVGDNEHTDGAGRGQSERSL